MENKILHKEIDLGGKKLSLETGKLAKHANAAVVATYGETVVLATVVAKEAPPEVDFFPLSVDFEEKLYASGKISSSRFIKREGRPSEKAVLTARLIDRSIRPLFPMDYQAEVQVIITVLSSDQENDPDVPSLIATSAALAISNVPWNGPISGLKVGKSNGNFIVNPVESEKEQSNLHLFVVSSKKSEVVMIESEANQADEKTVFEGIKYAVKEGEKVIKLIEDFVKVAGQEKQKYVKEKVNEESEKAISDYIEKNIITDLEDPKKAQDESWFSDSLEKLEELFIKEDSDQVDSKMLVNLLDSAVVLFLRSHVLKNKKRIDGRSPDEIRSLNTEVALLPRTHGSGLFERGETQILSVSTLASPSSEQIIDGMAPESTKRYMHHYNFPPFSAGEIKRLGSPGRREIGHGALAEKALIPILPSQDEFPYTIRIVSEVLSSAGSTSMASVCGSTLALMDAGVPIKDPVAGISIGLITDENDPSKYVTLTDIAYQEDAQGDMDFKVAGTKNGITAIQMDIKLSGISLNIIDEALEKAKKARLKILDVMLKTIPKSRETISEFAPTIFVIKIDPTKIGDVIGSGGKTINKIIAETGTQIDITDDGSVTISGTDKTACQKAVEWVEGLVKDPKPGEVYEGKVVRILPFGAFVEILPGKDGLVHISKLAPHRVENVEDMVKIGQIVKVRVQEIDEQRRINLTMVLDDNRERNDNSGRTDNRNKRFDRKPQRPRKKY